jgi:hypothetical protein
MSKRLSVEEILARMEARIAQHQERKAFHSQQEAHHREQLAFHDAELEKLLQRHEAFRAAADATAEYTAPPALPDPEKEEKIPRFGDRPMVSRLVARVVERQPEGEEFGAHAIAAEVNRRYGDKLDSPVKPSAVSTVLRRLARDRQIHQTRPGKAFHGALYVRGANGRDVP